jgi:hypothetical protein
MESDEEYNRRYQNEVNNKPEHLSDASERKITKARFIKMVKAGSIPGWSWIDDKDGGTPTYAG